MLCYFEDIGVLVALDSFDGWVCPDEGVGRLR
jgi:hypothetical protein